MTSFGEGVEQGGVTFCNHVAEIFTHTLSWCQADVIQREGFTAVPPLLDFVGILGGIFCCDNAWRTTKNHGVLLWCVFWHQWIKDGCVEANVSVCDGSCVDRWREINVEVWRLLFC